MSEAAWAVLALFAAGVFTGAISLFAWERVWLWRRMPTDQFAVDFRRSLRRADPAMPLLLVASAIGSIGLAGASEDATLIWAALACQVLILVGSVVLAEPINSRFRRLPEGVAPPDADRLRTRWRRLHLARTVLALGAFACLVTAVAQP